MSSSSGSHDLASSSAAAAAGSLELLLREDPLLLKYGLTESKSHPDQAAFPYAAALLENDKTKVSLSAKQRADLALQDVERKLALVESLGVKLSRTSPAAVAGHLLSLHGYHLVVSGAASATPTTFDPSNTTLTTEQGEQQQQGVNTIGSGTTLQAMRERADRLERQSEILESVAKRVESSLQRALDRMDAACIKLERVLTLSTTLKMILTAQFESTKLANYDLDDLRDLTRAAASVAVLEDLFRKTELQQMITVVEHLRPQANQTAVLVRQAAATLLEKHFFETVPQLGATLQVYFHLAELPQAVYKALDLAHDKAEMAGRDLLHPNAVTGLAEQARKTAKDSRLVSKKMAQLRLEAAENWATKLAQVAHAVRNLQRVLLRKTDPQSRKGFMEVLAHAPIPTQYESFKSKREFSFFSLFWGRFSRTLATQLKTVLENDKLLPEVAALYPPMRHVAKDLVAQFYDNTHFTTAAAAIYEDPGTTVSAAGVLGGSMAIYDAFCNWSDSGEAKIDSIFLSPWDKHSSETIAADSWTRPRGDILATADRGNSNWITANSNSGLNSVVFQSSEWKTLNSNNDEASGIYPLQKAFVQACTERLCQPLQYMFPENIAVDDDGVPLSSSGLSLLPSKYDVQRFDENIRQEFSLADPKEGGGELSVVTMIADCVVDMIAQFCKRARNAMSGSSDEDYLNDDWSMTDALHHDRKVAAIMYTLQTYLRAAPEKTFIAPYRPSVSPQQEEAADLCLAALKPALDNIDSTVENMIMEPLCRATNQRLADIIAKMHLGVYVDGGNTVEEDVAAAAFVQNSLAPIFEVIADKILSKFPPPYASFVAANIASFSIYAFVSNAALVRPLAESARLHVTQDLADLELSLEQLVMKGGSSTHVSQINGGKPYAELRAVRQMLFWNGLESKGKSGPELAKMLLRESWLKDVRPSTIIHYLFSSAPNLLSSPHHSKRIKPEEYVFQNLVKYDASVDFGSEEDAWMVTASCCDVYAQRATSGAVASDGDPRIASALMTLGPELLRRQRQ